MKIKTKIFLLFSMMGLNTFFTGISPIFLSYLSIGKFLFTLTTKLFFKFSFKAKILRQQTLKLTFHTNIALTDLLDKLDDNSFDTYKEYFVKKYYLHENIINLENTQIRNRMKEAMELGGEGRENELWANQHIVWGGETKMKAKDEHICDSKWEYEIDNYLSDSGIEHEKPQGASRGKYYRNTMMYPDWIINGVMIELFGAVHYNDYKDKMEYKKKNNLLPLRSISKDAYETGAWKDIIRKIINT